MNRDLRQTVDNFVGWWTAGKVAAILLVLGLVGGIAGYRNQHPGDFNLSQFIADFYANASSELASIGITVLIIDSLERRRDDAERAQREREKEEAKQERYKELLIHQLASKLNYDACQAAEQLRAAGWLQDGSLQGAHLRNANLEDADLRWANLERVQLYRANLRNANLYGANLQYAHLAGADLRGAQLGKSDLYNAFLEGVNLEGARKLGIRNLATASRLKGATMPDGGRYNGCFNLKNDLQQAEKNGVNLDDPAALAEWYGVLPDEFLSGQEWAAKNMESAAISKWRDRRDEIVDDGPCD